MPLDGIIQNYVEHVLLGDLALFGTQKAEGTVARHVKHQWAALFTGESNTRVDKRENTNHE